jgi:uncharacterized protein (TIGR02271 family)
MQHTLIAVFDNRADAERAQDDLLLSGFKRDVVRLSNSDPTGITDSVTGSAPSSTERRHEGIAASIKHFFTDIFGTDNSEHAQRYSDAVSRGHHVLTVTTEDEPEIERAADIVERHGPVDIDEKHAEWAGGAPVAHSESMRMSGAGGMQQSASVAQQSEQMQMHQGEPNLFAQQSLNEGAPMGQTYQEPLEDRGAPLQGSALEGTALQGGSGSLQRDTTVPGSLQGGTGVPAAPRDTGLQGSQQRDTGLAGAQLRDTSAAIPVVREELKVGKREVQRGGVRIFSHMVETPVDQSISLREEHVGVERHKVDQPLSPGDSDAFKEQTIEMRETAEEPVVEKTARVVEEVVVGKHVSERQQHIKDTVRHTEVQVENLGASALPGDEDHFRRHWNSQYGSAGGSYDEYAPAYSYGSEMARSDQYQGRKWNEIEPDLRSTWETRHPEHWTWDRVKAAAREGWDRITFNTASRSDWDTHYSSLGGSYEDYAPAYRYGSEMARSDKYRGRKWNDVESDLKSGWETRHPGEKGASTWERFKAAVRHGWDNITA